MGLINNPDRPAVEVAPGVLRRAIVNRDTGAGSLTTSYVTIAPGASTPVHRHQVEEAMFLCQAKGWPSLGDETFHSTNVLADVLLYRTSGGASSGLNLPIVVR